jgi:multiple sugar transport system permease protein
MAVFENKAIGFRLFFWIFIILIGFFVFFPLYWMINTSFKPMSDVFDYRFFPARVSMENFIEVVRETKTLMFMKNSLFVALCSCILATMVSAYAGYSFSKFKYKGRTFLMLLFLSSQLFPSAILLLTIYQIINFSGLRDSYISLILAFITFTLPVGTLTLKNFFDQIPDSIIESAKIDGAGVLKTLHRIVLPISIPALTVIAIYGFVWAWNDVLYSLTLITSTDKRTLAPGLILTYFGEFQSSWASMMTAAIIVSIPVAVIFVLAQKLFIQGLTSGAVKG